VRKIVGNFECWNICAVKLLHRTFSYQVLIKALKTPKELRNIVFFFLFRRDNCKVMRKNSKQWLHFHLLSTQNVCHVLASNFLAASIQNVASVVENFSKRKMSWVRRDAGKKEPRQTFVNENRQKSRYITYYVSCLQVYLFIMV
jgi:hypothetical protein